MTWILKPITGKDMLIWKRHREEKVITLFLSWCFHFISSQQIKLRGSNALIKFSGRELRNMIKGLHLMLKIWQKQGCVRCYWRQGLRPDIFKLPSLHTMYYMLFLVPFHVVIVTCRKENQKSAVQAEQKKWNKT